MKQLFSKFKHSLPFAAALLTPGFFALYIKYHLLNNHNSGYLALSRFLGRTVGKAHGSTAFGTLEKLSFFREDILLQIILIPLAISLLLSCLNRRWRAPLAIILSSLLLVVYFTSLLSHANVGTFLTAQMATEALLWGLGHPDDFLSYASPSSLLKLALLVVVSSALAILAAKSRVDGIVHKLVLSGVLLVMSAGAAAFVAGNMKTLPAPNVYNSVTEQIAAHFFQRTDETGDYAHLGYRQIEEIFAVETNHIAARCDRLFGRAAGRNVIMVVLETASPGGIDLSEETWTGGRLSQLAGAISSNRHFSTYPYTSDAHFSIFSSLYPLMRSSLLQAHGETPIIGWPDVLRREGYKTQIFYSGPSINAFEHDTLMYEILGFEHLYISSDQDPSIWAKAGDQAQALIDGVKGRRTEQEREALRKRLHHDIAALEYMREGILGLIDNKTPYVTAFMPMVGHAPWHDTIDTDDIFERGAALIKLQLGWVNSIAQELQNRGELKNTLFVIVGDHGLRTRTEYPELVEGALTATSVNVPFLLFADGLNEEIGLLNNATSHIDIGPSILALLGVNDPRAIVHGATLWENSIESRKIFFFGRDYLGADAFHQRGEIISCEYFNESCQSMPFAGPRIIPSINTVDAMHMNTFKNIRALQARTAQLHIDNHLSYEEKGALCSNTSRLD